MKNFELRDPELSIEEQQKQKVMDYWDKCNRSFTKYLNKQDLIDLIVKDAIKTGETSSDDVDHYVKVKLGEETNEKFIYYNNFCSYAFITWNAVKNHLNNIAPTDKKHFTKEIRKLRIIRNNTEDIQAIFEKLTTYVSMFLPRNKYNREIEVKL